MYALIYAAFKLLYLPNVPTVSEIILKLEHITITFTTRSQAVARIADRTAKNCRGHVT